jgi:hypothetical protein
LSEEQEADLKAQVEALATNKGKVHLEFCVNESIEQKYYLLPNTKSLETLEEQLKNKF